VKNARKKGILRRKKGIKAEKKGNFICKIIRFLCEKTKRTFSVFFFVFSCENSLLSFFEEQQGFKLKL